MRDRALHLARITDGAVDVVESYDKAYGFVDVAVELWSLADRPDRSASVEAAMATAFELEPPRLDKPRLEELCAALSGLEAALVGTLTDAEHLLSRERVTDLRGKSEHLDLGAWRGDESARYAVQEALIYVDNLRNIIDEALAADACIVWD
jgi:hypothetical protein